MMDGSGMRKEEIAEDYCFICKDGGSLLICEYGDCLKTYHPDCVEKDSSFMDAGTSWSCSWHTCSLCKKSSSIQCFCCPTSICWACIQDAEFVQVKTKSKGFCSHCLKLAILIEQNADVDSDGGKVDFKDTETYEFLFKDYWEIIKDKEGLSLEELLFARSSLKSGNHLTCESDTEKYSEEKEPADYVMDVSFDDANVYDDELSRRKGKSRAVLKRPGSKRKNFVGWGSEELINFLISIGKDTKEPIEHSDAFEIIKSYILANNLLHQDKKKKKVLCDDKLYALFKKKSVKLPKIYEVLESHFSANEDPDDNFNLGSEDEEDIVVGKRQRTANMDNKTKNFLKTENVPGPLRSCYASIINKNINLVYLRKSLILEFLKDGREFEKKVVGCFVRVKNDPKDMFYSPDRIHQLGLVSGTRKTQNLYNVGEIRTTIVLCVSNVLKDVHISMLSDDDFEEEECEDLRQSMRKGFLRRPTIAELEQKATLIHEDITNHWIKKELMKLEKQIDRANEKGWRRELFELIERKELLSSPDEQERLRKKIPEVIPDTEKRFEDNTDSQADTTGRNEEGQELLPAPATQVQHLTKIPRVNSETKLVVEGDLRSSAAIEGRIEERKELLHAPPEETQEPLPAPARQIQLLKEVPSVNPETKSVIEGDLSFPLGTEGRMEGNGDAAHDNAATGCHEGIAAAAHNIAVESSEKAKNGSAKVNKSNKICQVVVIDDDDNDVSISRNPLENQIIDLEDDDDDDDASPNNGPSMGGMKAYSSLWKYLDPQGIVQGSFSLEDLRSWRQMGYFDDDFKVWKIDQSQEEAILLRDALRLFYNKY